VPPLVFSLVRACPVLLCWCIRRRLFSPLRLRVRFLFGRPYPIGEDRRVCFRFAVVAGWAGNSLLSYAGVGTPSKCYSPIFQAFAASARAAVVPPPLSSHDMPAAALLTRHHRSTSKLTTAAAAAAGGGAPLSDLLAALPATGKVVGGGSRPPPLMITFVVRKPSPVNNAAAHNKTAVATGPKAAAVPAPVPVPVPVAVVSSVAKSGAPVPGLSARLAGGVSAKSPAGGGDNAWQKGRLISNEADVRAVLTQRIDEWNRNVSLSATTTTIATATRAVAPPLPELRIQFVDFGAFPFVWQANLSAHSDLLVGVHGAGLAHLTFLPYVCCRARGMAPAHRHTRHCH
jgi:hypothetical protein